MGIDERQAWHVIQRLDEMYRQLYREQQVRYEALLAQAQGRLVQEPVVSRRQPTPVLQAPSPTQPPTPTPTAQLLQPLYQPQPYKPMGMSASRASGSQASRMR